MERKLERISRNLTLPPESRTRIRSRLASWGPEQEEQNMKKVRWKTRIPLIAAAAVIAMALALTATAAVTGVLFRNDKIVASRADIPIPSATGGGPSEVGILGPGGDSPYSLEEMTQSSRFKSDDWDIGEAIGGGIVPEYTKWDAVEVLSRDPALRSRRVTREDGAEKMEYTAEDPIDLLTTLTGRVTLDLSWVDSSYDYVPDANMAFVVKDSEGHYVSETFSGLYSKKDSSGYVEVTFDNTAQADCFGRSYIVDGSYETAYYYTSADGYEFLIQLHEGWVWATCRTSHTSFALHGAYLTQDEVEDILDHLSLSIEG